MAVAAAVQAVNLPSKFRRFLPSPPKIAAQIKPNSAPPPPLLVSTNPSDVNLHQLRELYAVCDHSCHRFPNIDAAGRVEPVDALKLSTALSHSSVVVSVFTKPEFVASQSSTSANAASVVGVGGNWIRKVAPVTPENGRLIGFGRAVSDLGLTASIYDVMQVIGQEPFLPLKIIELPHGELTALTILLLWHISMQVHPFCRDNGIGRMIVKKIIRMLINRDIYDIAALCNDKERLFFRACGFGDDMLGATTMMYASSSSLSSFSEEEEMIVAGRKLLLVPPQRKFKQK